MVENRVFVGDKTVKKMVGGAVDEQSIDIDESALKDLDLSQKIDFMLKQNIGISLQLKQQQSQLSNIDSNFKELNKRLNAVEVKQTENSIQIDKLRTQRNEDTDRIVGAVSNIHAVRESCDFVSSQYDELLQKVAALETAKKVQDGVNKQQTNECTQLKALVANVQNELDQERQLNNSQHQYYRTCFHLKLCGVPLQPGEEEHSDTPSNYHTLKAIEDVCAAAHVQLDPNTIDVCHRLGSDPTSPIIIRFCTKSARFMFYNQRHNFNDITSKDVQFSPLSNSANSAPGARGARGGGAPRGAPRGGKSYGTRSQTAAAAGDYQRDIDTEEGTRIYVQEHLTKFNKTLLSTTKTKLSGVYKYPGYVKNGTIRVKKDDNATYQVVRTLADVTKLIPVQDDGTPNTANGGET